MSRCESLQQERVHSSAEETRAVQEQCGLRSEYDSLRNRHELYDFCNKIVCGNVVCCRLVAKHNAVTKHGVSNSLHIFRKYKTAPRKKSRNFRTTKQCNTGTWRSA